MSDRARRVQELLAAIKRVERAMEVIRAANDSMIREMSEQNRLIAGSLGSFRLTADVYSGLTGADVDSVSCQL